MLLLFGVSVHVVLCCTAAGGCGSQYKTKERGAKKAKKKSKKTKAVAGARHLTDGKLSVSVDS